MFARLMYPRRWRALADSTYAGAFRGGGGDWKHGYSMLDPGLPTQADRHFLLALQRRLKLRVHARSVEQPVDLDDGDDVYNWPWLYAVQPGTWLLSDSQAAKLRDYLLRGGFFMADDFWGDSGWDVFENSIRKVFPDRQIVDIPNPEAIFHTVYDLDDRYQVPGARYRQTGVTKEV